MPWPGTSSRRGGPLRVTEHADGKFTTLDGVGWSTDLADLARQQLAAGWGPGTRLQITKKDAAGRDIGQRVVSIRELLKPPPVKVNEPDPPPPPDIDVAEGVAVEREEVHHISAPPDPPTAPLRVVRRVVRRA